MVGAGAIQERVKKPAPNWGVLSYQAWLDKQEAKGHILDY